MISFLQKCFLFPLLFVASSCRNGTTISSVLNVDFMNINRVIVQNVDKAKEVDILNEENINLIKRMLSTKVETISNPKSKETTSYNVKLFTNAHIYEISDYYGNIDNYSSYYWNIDGEPIYSYACKLAGVTSLWEL